MKLKYNNLIISLIMSVLGTIFLIYYIFRASTDVVVSDYFRIINYYLEDVTDLHYLLSWEGISRIPFTFLARFINVKVFKYSVFFDKILGTFGLFLFNTIVVSFTLDNLKSKLMKTISSILITYISFSLMAWEMILNGTGYAHFITVGLIALTFKIFSNIVGEDTISKAVGASFTNPSRQKEIIYLCLLMPFTSLLFAGSYAVSYNCTLILFMIIILVYGIMNNRIQEKYTVIETVDKPFFKEDFEEARFYGIGKYKSFGVKRAKIIKYYPQLLYIIIPVVCLLLYFKSNNTGEALIPIGFKDISLVELLKTDLLFPIRFLLKSLASSIIGVETLEYAINFNTITEKMIFFIGFLYLIVIIYAIILLIYKIVGVMHREPLYMNRDVSYIVFVCMFFVYGIANYLLVFLARYKFVVDSYGMTSRYSLQYMFLTIAIVLLLTKYLDDIIVTDSVGAKHREPTVVGAKHCEPTVVGAKHREPTVVGAKHCEPEVVGAKHREPATKSNVKFKKIFLIVASILSLSFIFLGHLTTNTDEIFKADYRKIIYSIVEDKAKNYKNLSDEDLENSFEYHRGPEQIRNAFEILEKQHLNIFKN